MNARPAPDLAVPVTSSDHVVGRADAPITVVEYGDFECPNCKLAFPAVKLLLQRFGADIRFAYRHFPLEQPHPHALPAAEAAECAAAQDSFWQMHDLLFENQPRLDRRDLEGYARRIELDMTRFAAELDGHAHVGRVRGDIESGERSRVRGTPGFFVNGRIVDVSFGMRALFDAAEAELRNGGTPRG
jgi:protein-disulfide isomerase